jgi:HNH endonuclease
MTEPTRSALRREVERRAKGCCEYCQSPAKYATQTFALDHIIPRSQGGDTSLANLAFACQGCNNHKYNKTRAREALTRQLVHLFHPRRQRWQAHFTWDERFEHIIGLTATGRVTVDALQLNRTELVNLRRLLYAAGEHPCPDAEGG